MAAPVCEADDLQVLLSRINLNKDTHYANLKSRQQEAILGCKKGDVLAVLPTGYGKIWHFHPLSAWRLLVG